MSTHVSAELLSAYLDRQLAQRETRELEEHLESCDQCHVRLKGLRRVVASLQSLNPVAPPSTMEQAVARRIALADDRVSLLDRLEDGMSLLNRQNPILSMFAVVIALALFIYFFSLTLHQRETNSMIPVIFKDPPVATAADPEVAVGSTLGVAGRSLVWSAGGLWVEEGTSVDEVSRTFAAGSEEAGALLAAHPELADLAALGRSVVIAVDGEVVRLE